MLKAADKRRGGMSLDELWSGLGCRSGKLLLAADPFLTFVRAILKPAATATSLTRRQNFSTSNIVNALRLYTALMELHTSKQICLDLDVELHTQLVDGTVHATFKHHFDNISAPGIEDWMSLFEDRLSLAHECWARLSWQERAALKGGFLAQNLFRFVNQVCYALIMFSVWLIIQNNKLVYLCFATGKSRNPAGRSEIIMPYAGGPAPENHVCPRPGNTRYSSAG
jgi:hypothetical protein